MNVRGSKLAVPFVAVALLLALAMTQVGVAYAYEVVTGTSGGCTWSLESDGTLTIEPTDGTSGTLGAMIEYTCPWGDYKNQITSIVVKDEVKSPNGGALGTPRRIFGDMPNLKSVDFTGFDVSGATSLVDLFNNDTSLESITFGPKFDTSNVEYFNSMFRGTSALKNVDLSQLEFDKARNLSYFLAGSGIESFDASSIDTSNVQDFSNMFFGCNGLTSLDLSDFDITNATSLTNMFAQANNLIELDISGFDTTSNPSRASLFPIDGALEAVTLGPKFSFASDGYLPTGSWMSVDTKTVYSPGDLGANYDGATMAGTYVKVIIEPEDRDHYYYGKYGYNTLYEVHHPDEAFTAYCLNQHRSPAAGKYDRIYVESDADVAEYMDADYNTEGLDGDGIRKALITLIYYGFPNDPLGLQEQYNLSVKDFMAATQAAIWRTTNQSDLDYSKTNPDINTVRDILLEQTYDSIPNADNLRLYLYAANGGFRQNLLSITSVTDQAFGGVHIEKVDAKKNHLAGAVFTITNAETGDTYTVTTDAQGVAELCKTDADSGLPLGTYTVRETTPPAGFELSDDVFEFTLETDGEIVSFGHKNGGSYDAPLVFVDAEDADYEGGGIKIVKKGGDGAALAGATFAVLDNGGIEVLTLTTDENGEASTGARQLPLGDYTVKELAAPEGYAISGGTWAAKVETDGQYATVNAENTAKTGSASIEVIKAIEWDELVGDDYSFELYATDDHGAATGGPLQVKSNDAEGRVVFDPIEYTGADVGYVNYIVKEVVGDDNTVEYDTREQLITVVVADAGAAELECYAVQSEEERTFTNVGSRFGNLSLTKKVEGLDAVGPFEFVIEVAEDGAPYAGSVEVGYTKPDASGEAVESRERETKTFVDGAITVSVERDETALIQKMPAGATYTITETEVPGFSADSATGIVAARTTTPATIINTYTAKGDVELEATKVLTGKTLEAGQFSFQLKDSAGAVLQTKTNAVDGTVAFDAIEYTTDDVAASPVRYTISELDGGAAGYTYDATEAEVSVALVDNGDGTITATPTYAGNEGKFANAYKAEGSVKFEAAKKLLGRNLETDQFCFQLKDSTGKVLQTKTNAANGTIAFDALAFTQEDLKNADGTYAAEKTFAYTISEVDGAKAGYTYDKNEAKVTVTVKDSGAGALVVSATSDEKAIEFSNSYAAVGSIEIKGAKTLAGADLADGQFTFQLKDSAGKVVQEAVNAAGEFTFKLSYTSNDLADADGTFASSKAFSYTISEVNDGMAGVTYDETEYPVTVTVADNGDGTLSVELSGEQQSVSFANAYTSAGQVQLAATKTLTGKTLEAGQFTFQLKDAEGNVLQTKTNAADGAIAFDALSYTTADVASSPFTYTISEVNDGQEGVTYDSAEHSVSVALVDNGDGTITATPAYATTPAFSNTYAEKQDDESSSSSDDEGTPSSDDEGTPSSEDEGTPAPQAATLSLVAVKALSGPDGLVLRDGEFSFILAGEDGTALQTKTNGADGAVAFDALTFADPGVYTYKIAESTEGATESDGALYKGGVRYDTHECTVTVTVAHNEAGDALVATAEYSDGANASFANEYSREWISIDGQDSHPETSGGGDDQESSGGQSSSDSSSSASGGGGQSSSSYSTSRTTSRSSASGATSSRTATTSRSSSATTARTGDGVATLALAFSLVAFGCAAAMVYSRRRAR